jgi:putative photosynthetic complex assembly protein 2
MDSVWIAAGFVLFVWWFSTGAILYLVQRAERGGRQAYVSAVLLALPALLLGVLGIDRSLDDPSLGGVYLAFASALAIWGWFELAFLAGVITGPVTQPCPPNVHGVERFVRAWGTIAYSEMALIATLGLLVFFSLGQANLFGLWTFAVLFVARITAKLNVYLGVPNINDHFLPSPVRHLSTHFRKAPMNNFFPWSVTFLTFATACFIERTIAAPPGSGAEVGFALLATLTALALFEHWMMVLPLPDAALWTWALPRDKSPAAGDVIAAAPRRPEAAAARRQET